MFFRKNKKGAKNLAPKNRKKMIAHINIFKQANLGVFYTTGKNDIINNIVATINIKYLPKLKVGNLFKFFWW